ncbi:hypothetical protein N7527_005081 [Penicillium freii]|nr:hypothetical protein N7527_005081 [Penicillium freii]
MASIFENHPLELLEMIFQHLRRPPYSLYSLSLTCRKFYIIRTPTLYSSICLTNPVSSEKLARTLQQNFWLSSLVLELQVHSHPPQTDQTHDTFLDAIVQMPNLESLDNVQIESPTQYVGQRLRSLYLGAALKRYYGDGWLLDAHEVVFYMEQLEKLHIQDTHGQILAFPDGLTRFTMKGSWPDPGGRFTSWAYSHIVYPHQYIEKLKESSSAGLEYLDLDLWYPESLPDYDSLDFPIPSLPASLETLTLYGFKPVSISFGSLVERVEAGQLPNLRAVTYQKLYGQDREETGEQTEDWQNDIKSLRKLGVELSIVSRPGSSIILPENENWPCQCWIFDLEVAWW